MKTRVGVVGIIRNQKGEVLLCKMPLNRGVYPGQWAIPGGGIEEGETMLKALEREIREEVGLTLKKIAPFWFQDDTKEKIFADGHKEMLYMIHLVFDGETDDGVVRINDEFEEYAWVGIDDLHSYDLNSATVQTFKQKGWL